jgi:ectonucleotide pyrophosphatase/phosphodiesterase family protein 6
MYIYVKKQVKLERKANSKVRVSGTMDCTNYFSILFAFLVPCCESSKLLFFLVDGFRWDYFQLPGLQLEGFSRFFEQGTRAEWMVPDFPTNSIPNYKTLETGK